MYIYIYIYTYIYLHIYIYMYQNYILYSWHSSFCIHNICIYIVTVFYVAYILNSHPAHIYSWILSGITTFYVAWVLYFHYTYIFWDSIWHRNILCGMGSVLPLHIYILAFYLASHNILCGMGSVLPLHTYFLAFYLASQHSIWRVFRTYVPYIYSDILSVWWYTHEQW